MASVPLCFENRRPDLQTKGVRPIILTHYPSKVAKGEQAEKDSEPKSPEGNVQLGKRQLKKSMSHIF